MGLLIPIILILLNLVGFVVHKKKKLKTKSVWLPVAMMIIDFYIHRNNMNFYIANLPVLYYLGAFFFWIFATFIMWFNIFFEIKYNE